MSLSEEQCLPIFYAFGNDYRPYISNGLKSFGIILQDSGKGHDGKSRFGARFTSLSRGMRELRALADWVGQAVRTHRRIGFCLLVSTLMAGLLCWATVRTLPYAFRQALPFSSSLVFSAAVNGFFHRHRALEHPKFIPRIVHQTYPSLDQLPAHLAAIRESWVRLNPGWEIKFWDDTLCKEFVRTEFPEYYAAYVGLPKNVERADFFRYLVVLRQGGVYADIDTECKEPLDDLIRPVDTLLVGWEGEVPDDAMLVQRHFARHRQIQQWFFAGAPEHPALRRVCDHIAAHYQHSFREYTNLDTLERTGPGAWTDAVLNVASEYRQSGNSWAVRFLPVVSTGVHPTSVSTPGLSTNTPGILVLHHFLGSWKKRHGYKSNGLLNLFMTGCKWFASHKPLHLVPVVPYSKTPELEHYPVSINHGGTVFTMMVNLIGHGDLQSHEDVSAILTRFGNWQAGMDNTLTPRAPVALIGALGKAAPDSSAAADKPVFLDIGAGIGFYSMTAAARGHQVIATELAHRSVGALQDSIEQNGFHALIDVRGVAVGAEAGPACVAPRPSVPLLHAWRPEDVQRGYAAPPVHQWTGPFVCDRVVQRVPMGDLVPDGVRVGAVRVSAGGWTGEVLRGGLPFLKRNRPAAILVEVDMAEMARVGSHDFIDVVHSLTAIGYSNLGHSGHVCVERFEAMLATLSQEHGKVQAQDHVLRTDVNDLRQPAWCALDPVNVVGVLEQNRRNGLEKQDSLNAAGVELFLLQLNVTAPNA